MVILQQGQTWNLLSFPNRWALNPWCLFPQEDRRQNLFSSLGIGKLKRKRKKWKNTINLNNPWSYNSCKRTVWSNFLLRMCEECSIFKLLNGGDILGTWEFWLLYSQTMGKRRSLPFMSEKLTDLIPLPAWLPTQSISSTGTILSAEHKEHVPHTYKRNLSSPSIYLIIPDPWNFWKIYRKLLYYRFKSKPL